MIRSMPYVKTVLTCSVATILFATTGCQRQPGRWDQAQAKSEAKTAQQSSADRLGSEDANNRIVVDNNAVDAQPPPFTPGEPSVADEPVRWTPEGGTRVSDKEPHIDLDQLTSGDPLPGSEFNKFFPKQSSNYDMVAKQEKKGFSQYSLRLDGEEIAQLAVTDLRGNPQAAVKFEQPDMMIEGHPAKKDGSKGTALLVENRFQVKVRSPGENLNESDRVNWLKKFDLAGIASLAK